MSARNVTIGKQSTESEGMTTMTQSLQSAINAQDPSGKPTATMLKDEERQKCEIWSRVMGYHRPISGWNIGKKQEYRDRKYFIEPKGE